MDGNKRVGLAVALAFLALSGVRVVASDDELVQLILGVAAGTTSKAEVAVCFDKTAEPRV